MLRKEPESKAQRPSRAWRRIATLTSGAAALCAAVALRQFWPAAGAEAAPPAPSAARPQQRATSATPPATPGQQKTQEPQIVAEVNRQKISRNELAQECLVYYGEEVLDSLVNKYLVSIHCKERGISITRQEVQDEIDRMSERFGLPTDQFLRLLSEERNISAEQYARDIIWPMLALRKLAAEKLEVTHEDKKIAYETQYGPAVQARLIVCNDLNTAREVQALAAQSPDQFGELAKARSDDVNTALAKGVINPIRKHLGDPNIERVAFSLREGEVSEVVAVGSQYAILKCERHLPAKPVPMEQIERVLTEAIRDKKLRMAGDVVFGELKQRTQVENILNDPEKQKQFPGVAATINGHPITVRELAEETIVRHGVEVLTGMINRRILEQECQRRKVQITPADIDAEIVLSANAMGIVKPDGSADVERWLAQVQEESGLSLDVYRRDVVWQAVALRKLVADNVQITDEDMQKGFEANYGPRVRCRAIVLNNLRRAQQVWELARKDPTVENFGQLATQYSIEASTQALEGEVPPIQMHGGQPQIEKEAFKLKPGEISGIIQVDNQFVILYCEGLTEPTVINFDEVRNLIHEDVLEKKLGVAMAKEFSRLQDSSQIDNYLTGESQASVRDKALSTPRVNPTSDDGLPPQVERAPTGPVQLRQVPPQ